MSFRKRLTLIGLVLVVTNACALVERALQQNLPATATTPALIAATEVFLPPTQALDASPTLPATLALSETEPPAEPTLSPADRPGAEWTFLMYLDADDDKLEHDILIDMNEMERVGSTDEVQIVVQIDRYQEAYTGDGNWTSAKRFLVSQNGVMQALDSQELSDLGEINSSDPGTLADFITWGIQNYPAQKYALFMSDHGGGWTGGWSDPAPVEDADMVLSEIVDGIARGLQAGGVEKLELLTFDACLMSQFEVFATLYPYARYGLASEEIIPAIGLAYTGWLTPVIANPGMDGRAVAQAVIDTYINQDWRILDDLQRQELFGPGSAQSISDEITADVTLSAVDLESFTGVITAVDILSAALARADQSLVAEARTYAQSYYNLFGEGKPPSFLDLGHFAAQAARATGSSEVVSAAQAVQTALNQTLVAERHGAGRPGSTGLSIFFPNSEIYQVWLETYTYTTGDFPQISSWDDFLSYHYYGTPFAPVQGQVVAPPPGSIITAPGAGVIELLPIELSASSITQDESILLNSQVSGENIAFVYTFVGYYDQTANAVLVANMDYIVTDETLEVSGVYYPDFSGGPVDLEWEWSPVIYNLNDGVKSGFALFEPTDYGAPDVSSTYAVYGIWRYSNGSQPDEALVYFVDAEMKYAYAYSDEGGKGPPRQINPVPGDQFTVYYTIFTRDENQVVQTSYREGDTFTLGETWFTWEAVTAPVGSYVIGFIAEDFDGNLYYQVAPVEVR